MDNFREEFENEILGGRRSQSPVNDDESVLNSTPRRSSSSSSLPSSSDFEQEDTESSRKKDYKNLRRSEFATAVAEVPEIPPLETFKCRRRVKLDEALLSGIEPCLAWIYMDPKERELATAKMPLVTSVLASPPQTDNSLLARADASAKLFVSDQHSLKLDPLNVLGCHQLPTEKSVNLAAKNVEIYSDLIGPAIIRSMKDNQELWHGVLPSLTSSKSTSIRMDFFDTQHASLDSGMGSDNDSQLVRVWREKEELERKLNSMLDQQKGSRSSILSRPPSLGSPTNNNLVHGIQETLQNLVCQLEQFGQKFDALTTRVDEMEQKIHELQGTRQTVTLLQNNLVAKSLDLSEMTSRLELVERAQRGAATHSDLVKRKKILEQGGTNPLLVEKKQIPRKHSFPLARSTLEEPRPIFSRKIREKYEDRPTRKTSVPTRRLEQMSTPSSGGLRGVSSWSSFTAPRARFAGTGGENSGEEAVVALFFHNTDSPSGLSFELGDQLEIAGRTGEEFSMARNSQGQTGFIPNKLVQRVLPLDRSSWFYGNLREAEVETLLSSAIPGDFLVRITPENQYIVGLKGKTKVHHIPVPIVNGKVEMGGRSFANVPCMITYYLFSKVSIVFGEHLKRPLLK